MLYIKYLQMEQAQKLKYKMKTEITLSFSTAKYFLLMII